MTVPFLFLLFPGFARILHIFAREGDPAWKATTRDADEEIRHRIGRNKGRVASVTFRGEVGDRTRRARRVFDAVIVGLLLAGIAGYRGLASRIDRQLVLAAIPRVAEWATAASGAILLGVILTFLRGTARDRSGPGPASSRGSKRTSHFLDVAAWPDPRAGHRINISGREYAMMSGQGCVDVPWREDRLGDPWVEGFRPSDGTDCEIGVEK